MTSKQPQPSSSDHPETENLTPELPHPPKLLTPEPPEGMEAQSPTSPRQTPKPTFFSTRTVSSSSVVLGYCRARRFPKGD